MVRLTPISYPELTLLGSAVTDIFSETWKVTNIDLNYSKKAHLNILVDEGVDMAENARRINKEISKLDIKFDSIISVAGGYTEGRISEPSIFAKTTKMFHANLWPGLLAG